MLCTLGQAAPHLHSQIPLPEHAVCGASSHGSQEEGIDLNHLLHRLRCCSASQQSCQDNDWCC